MSDQWKHAVWENGEWVRMYDPRDGQKDPALDLLTTPDHSAPEKADQTSEEMRTHFETLVNVARRHLALTGLHLPVYEDIAALYTALTFAPAGGAGTEVAVLAPNAADDCISIDMSRDFVALAVIRITPGLKVSGRIIAREDIPGSDDLQRSLKWSDLPRVPANPTEGH